MKAELNAVTIRPALPGDEDGILSCLAQAFETYRAAYTPEAFADTVLSPERLAVRQRQMHVVVACASEKIVGTIGASVHGTVGHLRGMAVLPDWHGTGLAARLLAAIEAWLRTEGCTTATLDTTLPLQAAMRFYEKNGYKRLGKVSDFFGMTLLEYEKAL